MSLPNNLIEGVLTATTQTVGLHVTGMGGACIQLAGTFVGTVVFEGSTDGTNYTTTQASAIGTGTAVTGATAPGIWVANTVGLQFLRVRCSAFTSGAIGVIILSASASPGGSGGGGGGGGGAVTIADGADVAEGATTDVAVDGDAAGTVNAHLRGISKKLAASIAVTGPLTDTQLRASAVPVSLASLPSGAVTVADGADVTQGAIADVAVTGDNTGTVSAKLRGLSKIWADVWDSVNHWLKVSIQNATLAVTQSGTWNIATVTVVTAVTAITNAVTVAQNTAANLNATVVGTGTFLVQAAINAGTNIIGKVTTDRTTPGTTNSVAVISGQDGIAGGTGVDGATVPRVSLATNVGLPAGTQLLGKVGIDQTTPGTTNAIGGDAASGATDASNPVKVGGVAKVALPTAVSTGQRVNLLTDVYGRPFVRTGEQGPAATQLSANHAPAANTKATITVSSAGAGKRNVCTGLTVSVAAGSTAPAAFQGSVALIDGASGGTTYLWGPHVMAIPAVAGAMAALVRSRGWWAGSQATQMTLEFSGAFGANTIEAVSFEYCQIAE